MQQREQNAITKEYSAITIASLPGKETENDILETNILSIRIRGQCVPIIVMEFLPNQLISLRLSIMRHAETVAKHPPTDVSKNNT